SPGRGEESGAAKREPAAQRTGAHALRRLGEERHHERFFVRAVIVMAGKSPAMTPSQADFRFCRLLTRSLTTEGSASVEVSPRLPYSSSAIFLRMRRMILPERVFGRP